MAAVHAVDGSPLPVSLFLGVPVAQPHVAAISLYPGEPCAPTSVYCCTDNLLFTLKRSDFGGWATVAFARVVMMRHAGVTAAACLNLCLTIL